MSWVRVYDDHAVISPGEIEFPICDDCGKAYLGPAYYTFDPDDCTSWKHEGCTGNSCHECTGDDTYPDDEDDPRWNRPAHL